MPSKEELLTKFQQVPVKHKALVTAVVVVAVALGYYALFYKNQQQRISTIHLQIRKADEDLIKKRTIANNLHKFRRQVEQLNQQLKEALALLPNSADIPDLLTRVAAMAEKSGLELIKFKLEAEQPRQFFAEVPVKLEVRGNFHELAVFFDKVSKLPRIINVEHLSMVDPQMYNQKYRVKANFDATTYRFLSPEEIKQAASAPGKKQAGDSRKSN
ncbi:MAG: type 4a pilus biogenesis protein PilO [Myxococcota bacterium]